MGKPGSVSTRVARAILRDRLIVEESVLVPTASLRNVRQFSSVLADLFAPPAQGLPARNVQRVDDEVLAKVQAAAVPLTDSFNSALRRLLGLDPPLANVQTNGQRTAPTL